MQIHEVLVRLQLRVRLHGRLQVEQRAGQRVFGGGTLDGGRVRVRRGRSGSGARPGHLGQHGGFMPGVPLDRFDQVRYQVGALLELHVDLCPAILHAIAQRDQRVVGTDRPQHQRDDDDDDYRQNDPPHVHSFVSLLPPLKHDYVR